jgi:two-component system response regulator YesN
MTGMAYKVFFVEDEVVTREGIRDNVDWEASGFEFCGEAADGEMALPLILTAQPDVLITDIKMPFMDGLQLSKIMRERMPWVKIVILSGHDEFEYAQQAISLGVTDYLLKPVTVQKIRDTLQKLTVQLDREKEEHDNLNKLQEQVEENRTTLRERLLYKMIVGAVSPTEVIEKGQMLGLELSARYYSVVFLKIELNDRTEQYDHEEFQLVQDIITGLSEENPDIFVLKRDWGDMILIIKGNAPEFLEEEREFLLGEIKRNIAKTRYKVTVGMGTSKKRIADICQSFIEAIANVQNQAGDDNPGVNRAVEQAELLKLDNSAVENFLRHGSKVEFDKFITTYLQPLGGMTLKSNLVKNYIFVDIILAIAKVIKDLGGDVDKVIPELDSIENITSNIKTMDQLQEQVCRILTATFDYRDSHPDGQYKKLTLHAKRYIEHHYSDSDLSLNTLAVEVNLSASHFSVVFSQETGQTFKEYLTEIRINKAKELLRMTSLRSADIAYQVGYNDPHYFSTVFKKNTGLSPIEFRSQI